MLLAACHHPRDVSRQEIAEIEKALAEVRVEAEKYMPDQVASIDDQLDNFRAAFDKKSYDTILTNAPQLLTQVKSLRGRILSESVGFEEMFIAEWARLTAVMPVALEETSRQISMLERADQLPANVKREAVVKAPAQLRAATEAWELATAARSSGELQEARIQMNLAKLELELLMNDLGMNYSFAPASSAN